MSLICSSVWSALPPRSESAYTSRSGSWSLRESAMFSSEYLWTAARSHTRRRHRRREERLCARRTVPLRARKLEHRLGPLATLGEVEAVPHPEGANDFERDIPPVLFDAPAQRLPQVVMLEPDAFDPRQPPAAREMGRGVLAEAHRIDRKRFTELAQLPVRQRLLDPELAHRLKHSEQGLSGRGAVYEQILLDQARDQVE